MSIHSHVITVLRWETEGGGENSSRATSSHHLAQISIGKQRAATESMGGGMCQGGAGRPLPVWPEPGELTQKRAWRTWDTRSVSSDRWDARSVSSGRWDTRSVSSDRWDTRSVSSGRWDTRSVSSGRWDARSVSSGRWDTRSVCRVEAVCRVCYFTRKSCWD